LTVSAASANVIRLNNVNHHQGTTGMHMVILNSGIVGHVNPDKLPAACQNPSFPLICVSHKNPGTLGIEINCGSTICPPSDVFTWTSSVSNKLGHPAKIKATFSPNPGNPVTETLTETGRNKPGMNYSQSLMSCDTASCVSLVAQVIVYK
jgi:hypothetical protein